MNKPEPDYATQWEAMMARIAHIERLIGVVGTILITIIAFTWNRSIKSTTEFWCAMVILFVIGTTYLHLTFILVWHGRQLASLEKNSDGEFSLFRNLLFKIPPIFLYSFVSIVVVPCVVTAALALNFREYGGPWTLPFVLLLALRDGAYAVVVHRTLVSLRDDLEDRNTREHVTG